MTHLLNPHICRATRWFAKRLQLLSFDRSSPSPLRTGILQSTPLLEVELGPGPGPAPRSPGSSHAEGPAGSVRLSRPQMSPSFKASAPCLGRKVPPRLQHAQDDPGEEGWLGCLQSSPAAALSPPCAVGEDTTSQQDQQEESPGVEMGTMECLGQDTHPRRHCAPGGAVTGSSNGPGGRAARPDSIPQSKAHTVPPAQGPWKPPRPPIILTITIKITTAPGS